MRLRNFGFDGYDKTACLGANTKMSEFAPAYGLTAQNNLEDVGNQNESVYKSYLEIFKDFKKIKFLEFDDVNAINFHYIVTRVNSIYRDQRLAYFHQK